MIEINLFPWREQLKLKERWRQGMEVTLSLGLSFFLIVLLHWGVTLQMEESKTRLVQLQLRFEKVKRKLEDVRVIYQALEYQKIPEMDLRAILSHQERILDFLQKMAQWTPQAISLSQVRLEKNSWYIEGLSSGINDILHYSENLGAAFKKTHSMDIRQKEGLFYFQFRIESPA